MNTILQSIQFYILKIVNYIYIFLSTTTITSLALYLKKYYIWFINCINIIRAIFSNPNALIRGIILLPGNSFDNLLITLGSNVSTIVYLKI